MFLSVRSNPHEQTACMLYLHFFKAILSARFVFNPHTNCYPSRTALDKVACHRLLYFNKVENPLYEWTYIGCNRIILYLLRPLNNFRVEPFHLFLLIIKWFNYLHECIAYRFMLSKVWIACCSLPNNQVLIVVISIELCYASIFWSENGATLPCLLYSQKKLTAASLTGSLPSQHTCRCRDLK